MRGLRGLLICGGVGAYALALVACAGDPTGITPCSAAPVIHGGIAIVNAIKPLGAKFMADELLVYNEVVMLCASPVANAPSISANVQTLRTMSDQANGVQPMPAVRTIPLKAK